MPVVAAPFYMTIQICLILNPASCMDVQAHIPGLTEISCNYQGQNFAAQHIEENYPKFRVSRWKCERPHNKV